MCSFAARDDHREYIVATEIGLIHTLQKRNPAKIFHPLSREITCPNMRKGSLDSVVKALEGTGGERVTVAPDVVAAAERSLRRMLEMAG
jgi:quinolinate synthase